MVLDMVVSFGNAELYHMPTQQETCFITFSQNELEVYVKVLEKDSVTV